MKNNENSLELEELREAARIGSLYQKNLSRFKRNTKISEFVHAMFHLSEFFSVLAIELFHHIHHAINRNMREKNPEIADLPEERNVIFFGYPISMATSIISCIAWILCKHSSYIIEMSVANSILGVVFMLLSAIFSMRHAEIYINIEEISDEELLLHPIFIHNFILCFFSIFAFIFYIIHFWILYDAYQWKQRIMRNDDDSSIEDSSSSEPGPSRGRSNAKKDNDLIPRWDSPNREYFHERLAIEDEPVILYCCCLDLWNYLAGKKQRNAMAHEFQVIHVV